MVQGEWLSPLFWNIFKEVSKLQLDHKALYTRVHKNEGIVHYQIKIKLRSFKSSKHINEESDGPYRGFGYSSLFSDPLDLATWSQSELQ